MSRFINPFTDYGFKKIFGQEVSKELLIDFLNSLLLGERVIKDLTFLNSERLPGDEDMRSIIYDVYCTTDSGEQIIVEMPNIRSVSLAPFRYAIFPSSAVPMQVTEMENPVSDEVVSPPTRSTP